MRMCFIYATPQLTTNRLFLSTFIFTLKVYQLLVIGTTCQHLCQKLTLRETFDRLPIAIQQACGRVVFPPNNGTTLLIDIATTSGTLFGASDASLKNHQSSHAWIISSGSTQDIEEPLWHIYGSGPVHGAPQYLSSSRGELQGLTALSIVANLLSNFSGNKLRMNAICDNSGVISKCTKGLACSLRGNKAANLDLYLTQKHQTSSTPTIFSWVRGHADKEQWQTMYHTLTPRSYQRKNGRFFRDILFITRSLVA